MFLFKQRSYQQELLDRPDIPFEDIKRNMQELDTINHRLGGHSITVKGVQEFVKSNSLNDTIHIVEIGCGGGDNLRVVKNWAASKNIPVQLTGIDINPACIAFAKSRNENAGIHFITSDYRHVQFDAMPHLIFSSLFCHHFTDEALAEQLIWMKQNSRTGFFINDLHRHPLAYYSIKALTKVFSKSYLVKNDAPLSVLRGFRRKDWKRIFAKAGINHFSCRWQWAFRWLIIYKQA